MNSMSCTVSIPCYKYSRCVILMRCSFAAGRSFAINKEVSSNCIKCIIQIIRNYHNVLKVLLLGIVVHVCVSIFSPVSIFTSWCLYKKPLTYTTCHTAELRVERMNL